MKHISAKRTDLTSEKSFTLIELIVIIVIIGIIIFGLIMGIHESMENLAWRKNLQSAALLSEDLMNEIRSKNYVDPQFPTNFGREPGETLRRQFDDVDDYNGLTDSPPTTIEGVILTNDLKFTRRAIVVNVTSNFNGAPQPANSTDFKRITVMVSNAAMAMSNVSVVSRYD